MDCTLIKSMIILKPTILTLLYKYYINSKKPCTPVFSY